MERVRRGFTLIELLVVIAIIALLLAMLLPAIQRVRAAADRLRCGNNMRQIALAALMYHDDHGKLPPGYEVVLSSQANGGRAINGFLTKLLPYIEEVNLEKGYDYQLGFDHALNQPAVSTRVSLFQCPATPGDRFCTLYNYFALAYGGVAYPPGRAQATDYTGVRGFFDVYGNNRRAVFDQNIGKRLSAITDGTSNTIFLIEKAGMPTLYARRMEQSPATFPWYSPWYGPWAGFVGDFFLTTSEDGLHDTGPCIINGNNIRTPYSFHPGGVNAVFCDGSVHFLKESMDRPTFWNLLQHNDGQVLGEYD